MSPKSTNIMTKMTTPPPSRTSDKKSRACDRAGYSVLSIARSRAVSPAFSSCASGGPSMTNSRWRLRSSMISILARVEVGEWSLSRRLRYRARRSTSAPNPGCDAERASKERPPPPPAFLVSPLPVASKSPRMSSVRASDSFLSLSSMYGSVCNAENTTSMAARLGCCCSKSWSSRSSSSSASAAPAGSSSFSLSFAGLETKGAALAAKAPCLRLGARRQEHKHEHGHPQQQQQRQHFFFPTLSFSWPISAPRSISSCASNLATCWLKPSGKSTRAIRPASPAALRRTLALAFWPELMTVEKFEFQRLSAMKASTAIWPTRTR
mmetsp:Transcript_10594/g.24678  ORF Transcript_10594/g.24678 Transcript_10594/m.24678 type:complete len:323 (+) Transcript_10594:151-1119(+)